MSAAGRVTYEFGEFRLNPHTHVLQAIGDGRTIDAAPRVVDTLLYMIEHRGELLEKAALMKTIWPSVVVEENNLNQLISTLRRALGDGRSKHRYISTVPGRGYRFVCDVRVREMASDEGSRQPSRPAAPRASLAVLPFANLSGDKEKEYFSDGMAEELIHLLSRVAGLKVPARTSSFAYKGRNIDVREIGRDLGVATVLEGSVRSAGERIRIAAQMVDAESGYHVWSQTFDRKFEDIFALQDDIARSIVQALKTHMNVALQTTPTTSPPTHDVEAYELYLQGLSVGARGSGQCVRRAIELFEQAIARDPGFARAFGAMANMRIALIFFGEPTALLNARSDAERALALDPTQVEAHSALGMVNLAQRRWFDAHASFEAAGPPDGNLGGLPFGAHFFASVGYLRKTLEFTRAAHRAAPAVPMLVGSLAAASLAAGLTADAKLYADLAVDLGSPRFAGPLPTIYSFIAQRAGHLEEAAEYAMTSFTPALDQAGAPAAIRLVYRALEDFRLRRAAVEALDRFTSELAPDAVGPNVNVRLIGWYTLLDELDRAFEVADRALDDAERSQTMGIHLPWLWMPELLAFRRDARFSDLTARLALTQYWAMYGPPDGFELKNGRLIGSTEISTGESAAQR